MLWPASATACRKLLLWAIFDGQPVFVRLMIRNVLLKNLFDKQLYKDSDLKSQDEAEHPFQDNHVGLKNDNVIIPFVESFSRFERLFFRHIGGPHFVECSF